MTRKRSRRILGMTVGQIFILLILACVLVASLGGGAWMVAQSYGITFSGPTARPIVPTNTLMNTSIPLQTFTPLPTVTNTRPPTKTPTITPIPYEAYVPAGWNRFDNGRVEIWLPGTFAIVGDADLLQQEIGAIYKTIKLTELVEQREKEIHSYELLFRHGPQLNSYYVPLVYVQEYERNGRSLDEFNDQFIQKLGITSTLVERGSFEFYQAEGQRLVTQTNFSNVYVNFYHYMLVDGDKIWEIGCDIDLIDDPNFSPVFDDIARTFRPVKK
jgi:hypothetical protein